MNILLLGATGMVGQGVLRERLPADDVALVQTAGRTATGQQHPRLRELVHADMFDHSAVEAELANFDACFFCIGVTSSGIAEAQYTRLTHDLTLAVALLPTTVLSTEIIGRALLAVARRGAAGPVLEAADIGALGRA